MLHCIRIPSLDFQVRFEQGLTVNRLVSSSEETLSLTSTQAGIDIAAADGDGAARVKLESGHAQIEAATVEFADALGASVLSLSKEEVRIDAAKVVVNSAGGLAVKGSVQTNVVQNEFSQGLGLTVESVGQDLHLEATDNVMVSSERGSVEIVAKTRLTVDCETVELNAAVVFSGLDRTDEDTTSAKPTGVQLCICGTETARPGLLYKADAGATCSDSVSRKDQGPCRRADP